MNVYDEAHNLEKAIRESEEFKQMQVVQEKVNANPELKKVLDDFHQKQLAVQTKQMMGEEIGSEVMQSVQELYAVVAKDPLAAEFLQCEMRFGVMMQDVYKILGDVVSIGK